jgi:hypothetical protein
MEKSAMKAASWIGAMALVASASGPTFAIAPPVGFSIVPSSTMPSPTAAAAAAAADESDLLRVGVITAVSDAHDQIQVNGSWFKVVDGATRVIREGTTVKAASLVQGQKVSFTLAKGAADRATLGAVYVP